MSQSQVQAQKAAVSLQKRIAELVEDNRRLAYEREYFDRLTENAMGILPQVVYHVEALSDSTRKYIARVDRAKVRKESINEVRFGSTPSAPPLDTALRRRGLPELEHSLNKNDKEQA
ncbi:hypothetical protein FCULG_00012849 [Fusarium culmorum]|uniref:Uncharacterized protein n=1 Tax=Fusarium culmorum TaxID=5516 RepID=A0A2T4GFY9_FUSCU|nr:hypothetical protein FCULG_00012849 [Fusarium culmorum]